MWPHAQAGGRGGRARLPGRVSRDAGERHPVDLPCMHCLPAALGMFRCCPWRSGEGSLAWGAHAQVSTDRGKEVLWQLKAAEMLQKACAAHCSYKACYPRVLLEKGS